MTPLHCWECLPKDCLRMIGWYLFIQEYRDLCDTVPGLKVMMSWEEVQPFFCTKQDRLVKTKNVYYPADILWIGYQPRTGKMKILYRVQSEEKALTISSFVEFEKTFPLLTCKEAFPRWLFQKKSAHGIDEDVYELGPLFYDPLRDGQVGMKVDAMDSCGIWYEGQIIDKRVGAVLVRYLHWSNRWATWYKEGDYGLAAFRTFTLPWRTALKVGDKIEFKMPWTHYPDRWYVGTIVEKIETTIEVHPQYPHPGFMTDIEDPNICPFGLHSLSEEIGRPLYRSQFQCLKHPKWRDKSLLDVETNVRLYASCTNENKIASVTLKTTKG